MIVQRFGKTDGDCAMTLVSLVRLRCAKLDFQLVLSILFSAGRPCIHRIHALPDDLQSQKRHSLAQDSYYDEDEEDDYDEDEEEYYEKDDNEQAIMPHSSGFRSLHACNCGRSRQTRDDPFDLRQANYEFYIMPCCAQCPRLALPAAIGSGSDAYFPSW